MGMSQIWVQPENKALWAEEKSEMDFHHVVMGQVAQGLI